MLSQQRVNRRIYRLILMSTAALAVTGTGAGNAHAQPVNDKQKCTLPFEIPASQGGFVIAACARPNPNGVPQYTLRVTNRTSLPRTVAITVEDKGLQIQYNVRELRAGQTIQTPPIGLATKDAVVTVDAQSAPAHISHPWAAVGTDTGKPTLPKITRCDEWHWKSQEPPVRTRRVAGRWTVDNTRGVSEKKVTQTVQQNTTSSFTNSASIEASASVGFKAFSTELKATYGVVTAQAASIKKGERVQFSVPPGKKETLHVGIVEVTSKGFYYRLSDCDSATPKLTYYLNVQETAPLPGKVTWAS